MIQQDLNSSRYYSLLQLVVHSLEIRKKMDLDTKATQSIMVVWLQVVKPVFHPAVVYLIALLCKQKRELGIVDLL